MATGKISRYPIIKVQPVSIGTLAGMTAQNYSFTWTETLSSAPTRAWLAQHGGTGGASVTMSLLNVSSSGGTIAMYNARSSDATNLTAIIYYIE